MSHLRVVEPIMGTVVDIDVRRSELHATELTTLTQKILSRLEEIECVFSTYSDTSEITRLGRDELAIDNVCDDVRTVLDFCEIVKATSANSFDIHVAAATEPARSLQQPALAREPSGLVKGWAIGQAVDMFYLAGIRDFCINIGGDLYASGDCESGKPWRIGLQHPFEPTKVMAVLEIRNMAVATSAMYERGAHILDKEGKTPSGLSSLTVVGPDITLADAYATAAFAKGVDGPAWINALNGFEVFAVDENGITSFSPGMQDYFAHH